MDYETVLTIQGYAKFFLMLLVSIVFYSYAYSMYKRQRTGERDYEKYTDIVHNDSFEIEPLEKRKEKNEKLEKGEK